MNPLDAQHYKAILYDQLAEPEMVKFLDYWASSDGSAKVLFPRHWRGPQIAQNIRDSLVQSETYYVAKDISAVISEVALTMKPERLAPSDLPSTHGFQVFEQPVLQTDVHGLTIPVRAVLWSTEQVGRPDLNQPVSSGVVYWAFSDLDDRMLDDYFNPNAPNEPKAVVQRMLENRIRFLPYVVYSCAFGYYALEFLGRPGIVGQFVGAKQTLAPNKDEDFEDLGNGRWLFDPNDPEYSHSQVQLQFESRDENPYDYDPHSRRFNVSDRIDGKLEVTPEPNQHYQQALWAFMRQEIAAREPVWTRRSVAKQLQRRQLRTDPVTLIKLRRRAPGPERGDRTFEYSHQFIVKGHWRRQWYPSEQRHRQIRIHPYLKGPDGAPMLNREHLYGVVR